MKIPNRLQRPLLIGAIFAAIIGGVAFAFTLQPGTRTRLPVESPAINGGGQAGGMGGGSGGGGVSCVPCCGTTTASCGGYDCAEIARPDSLQSSAINPDLACGAPKCPTAPTNGSYSCAGTNATVDLCNYACNLTCTNSTHPNECTAVGSTSCVADTATACGASCTNCVTTQATHSTGACVNGACECTCNAGFTPGTQAACSTLACVSRSFATIY